MSRILLTGAAGMLGKMLRETLHGYCDMLRVSDIAPLENARQGEEVIQCDLGDLEAVTSLVDGCDFIIHLGGMSVENKFETILNANIRGTYHIYEAARQKSVSRILFASSNHAIGFHERDTVLDADAPTRPDSLYGVSKCFGENLARYYYDKFAIETAVVRIGSCFPKPMNKRMMATWMSYQDFTNMVKSINEAEQVGYSILYGASANKEQWWNNHLADHLGWVPQDSSEQFATNPEIVNDISDPMDPAVRFQGGPFAAAGHFED